MYNDSKKTYRRNDLLIFMVGATATMCGVASIKIHPKKKSAFLILQVLVLVRPSHHLVPLGFKTLDRPGLLVAEMMAMAMVGHMVITGTQSTDPVLVVGTRTM